MPTTNHPLLSGYTMPDTVLEQARAALRTHAPDLPELTPAALASRRGICLVPNVRGEVSKLEITLISTPGRTIKINAWHAPDIRDLDRRWPHNHRWASMRSIALHHDSSAAYSAELWRFADDGALTMQPYTQLPGGDHTMAHHEFHEVVATDAVLWTVLLGNASVPGNWGVADPETGQYHDNSTLSPDPNFSTRFAELNPHWKTAGSNSLLA